MDYDEGLTVGVDDASRGSDELSGDMSFRKRQRTPWKKTVAELQQYVVEKMSEVRPTKYESFKVEEDVNRVQEMQIGCLSRYIPGLCS